ncbi:response regulator transcription factor [Actinomycetaceae bacterium L2_0104]
MSSIDENEGNIRVGLVDDQNLVRTGFAMVIDSQPDMEVVVEASNGKLATERLAIVPVDVVLMDIRMPVMDGLEATRIIAEEHYAHGISPKIIILTTFEEDQYILGAVQAGASGFLVKDAPPAQMLEAIRTVHRGDAVIAPSSTRRLVEHLAREAAEFRATDPSIIENLTEREREVLVHVAHGESNQEIAAALFVAEATIKTHIGRIFAKLGARDRVQAVVLAYESGLVRPGEY